ncbi:hypothetical protein KDW_41530 [Dictyobacter vulcani]|uniref:Uncharacterized protein n=1 Tax=Dictyobacter vulcani TaxID=2607529 RepID=A0A5J4KU43_9CHLR|nr:hypothetical protein KDW_41530 [Dictyobacter vulcani]
MVTSKGGFHLSDGSAPLSIFLPGSRDIGDRLAIMRSFPNSEALIYIASIRLIFDAFCLFLGFLSLFKTNLIS